MVQIIVCAIPAILMFLVPFSASAFDCNRPPFGTQLETLNSKSHFVRYMEKEGVSYYRYTGPCRMSLDEQPGAQTVYAFVNNRLYAQIMQIPGNRKGPEAIRQMLEEQVFRQMGTPPYEMKQDGDWWVYQWVDEKKHLKLKLKVHSRTNEGKCAFYYEPLRQRSSSEDLTESPF